MIELITAGLFIASSLSTYHSLIRQTMRAERAEQALAKIEATIAQCEAEVAA